jgi:class 3 adenylate cyclase
VRKEISFEELNMRIGIHYGKILGGIIGSDIIRFDIYGDDVLIANKMESEGEKGKINVSRQVKELIENSF